MSSCPYKQETHIPTSKEGILKANENDSFDVCESYLLEKMTYATLSKSSEREKDLLRIIHSDIWSSFQTWD